VVSIEAIRRSTGRYEAYTDNGRERTGVDAVEWAARAAELGAGEILVTSIEREGTGEGFDLELARTISESVPIPVVVSGGAGTLEQILDVAVRGKAQAICLASMLHYNFCRHNPGLHEGVDPVINTTHLQRGSGFERVHETSLPVVKSFLLDRGIDCRPVETVSR
jgi:cyclase